MRPVFLQRYALEVLVEWEETSLRWSPSDNRQRRVETVQEVVDHLSVLDRQRDIDRRIERTHQQADRQYVVVESAVAVKRSQTLPQKLCEVEIECGSSVVHVHRQKIPSYWRPG